MNKKKLFFAGLSCVAVTVVAVFGFVGISGAASTFSSDSIPKEIIDQQAADNYSSASQSATKATDVKDNDTSQDLQGSYVEGTYRSVNELAVSSDSTSTNSDSAINFQKDVTEEMCQPEYFANLAANPDRVLKTKTEISQINTDTVKASGTNMVDLTQEWETTDKTASINSALSDLKDIRNKNVTRFNDPDKDDESADVINKYFDELQTAIEASTSTTDSKVDYAVAVHNTAIKAVPTADLLFQKGVNTDDCNQNSSITVNEPFVIRLYATFNDKKFAWGTSDSCGGWVAVDDLAVFSNSQKSDWLSSWQVGINDSDFIVVTADKIYLEESVRNSDTSKLMLPLGTILKLVPKDKIPGTIGDDRVSWNNYVVYVPTRNTDGSCTQKMCLISQHCSVSVGFLPFTQRNLLHVGYNNLGNRYGWGNMLNAFDCSGLQKSIYRCFGFNLPRNTTWQSKIPNYSNDISNYTREQKLNYIKSLPAGTILIFSSEQTYAHEVMYLGSVGDKLYILHDNGSLYEADSSGSRKYQDVMTVIISSTDVYRGNGKDYLDCIGFALNFRNVDFTTDQSCSFNVLDSKIEYTGSAITPTVQVKDGDSVLTEGIHYTKTISNNVNAGMGKIVISGIGSATNATNVGGYTGTVERYFEISKAKYAVQATGYTGVYDGNPHSISINNIITGSSVLFNVDGTSTWSDKNPARITPGTTVVNYKIEHQNYETITGAQTISITDGQVPSSQTGGDELSATTSTSDNAGVLVGIFAILVICSGASMAKALKS